MYFLDDGTYNRGPGMIGKFADAQLLTMREWPSVSAGADDPVGASMATTRITPRNGSTCTVVNQLLPLEYDWLDVPGPTPDATRAARW